LNHLVPFISVALRRGDSAVVIATATHHASLLQRLKVEGLNMEAAISEGRYVTVDAAGTLSIFMVNGMPEPSRFFRIVSGLIEEALKTATTANPRLAAFGEWVSVLCQTGQADAALRLEQMWNQVADIYELDLLCGYEMGSMNPGAHDAHYKAICTEHSGIRVQKIS
jgi:hypothetical protein